MDASKAPVRSSLTTPLPSHTAIFCRSFSTEMVASLFTSAPSISLLVSRQNLNQRNSSPVTVFLRGNGAGFGQFQCRKSCSASPTASLSGNLDAAAVPTSVPVRLAHELFQAGHRYLDVRTPEEFSAGHVPGAVNVPYMYRTGSGMSKNPNFLEDVSSCFSNDDEILVGCQSGKRSLMAAADLGAAGFSGITDIAGGYAAWTENGLPTQL